MLFCRDSPLWRALTKVVDLIWLNILFVICCIPVFTVGAALSAMYSVTLKMCVNEEGAISQDFFKAFRENFKQATILWGIMLGIGIFLIADFLMVPLLGSITTRAYLRPIYEGKLPYDDYIKALHNAGCEYALVEQDYLYGEDPFDCLKRSYDHILTRPQVSPYFSE